MRRIVLIACVAKKKAQKAKVRDLYVSQLFKSSLAYAEALRPDAIYVLSALHHVLELDRVIAPYDVTLSAVPKTKRKPSLIVLNREEKQQWGSTVFTQLAAKADLQRDQFTILAGQAYIKPIEKGIKNLHNPLQGLGQGKRVSFLQASRQSTTKKSTLKEG